MDKILIVNKEKDYTSRDVINILSGIFKTKKIGHFGTLDPLASGVLVVGIGNYTKLEAIIDIDTKEYIAEVLVGKSSDTYDITGNITEDKIINNLDQSVLLNTLNSFKGSYLQEVPIYSSVKVNGKKLYEYARNNIEVILPSKEVTISDIKLLNIYEKNKNLYFKFSCLVSKGTYIRSLINDISKKLEIPLCMSELIRTKQGPFLINNAYTLDEIRNNQYKFIDLEDIINIVVEEITDDNKKTIYNGNIIKRDDSLILFKDNNQNIALYKKYDLENNLLKPIIIY